MLYIFIYRVVSEISYSSYSNGEKFLEKKKVGQIALPPL